MTKKDSNTRKTAGKTSPGNPGADRTSDGSGGKAKDDGVKHPPSGESASVIVRPPTDPH